MSRARGGKEPSAPLGFPCSMCTRVLNTRWARDEHELTHMGVRVQCPNCPKDFSNRSNLARHYSTEHQKTFTDVKVGTLYSFDGQRFHCGECASVYEQNEENAYWDHISKHYKK